MRDAKRNPAERPILYMGASEERKKTKEKKKRYGGSKNLCLPFKVN